MRAVVTGANRGIGQEVVRQLEGLGHDVMGAHRGGDARHRLDLTDPRSIDAFCAALGDDHRLDVVVHNAATLSNAFDADVARDTLATNVLGTIALSEALVPRLAKDARVVIVSSGMGELSGFRGEARRALEDPANDVDALLALADRFVRAVADGTHAGSGWPSSAYSASKGLINAYARHLARRLAEDPRHIRVVAVCPGWVRTRMGGAGAPRSVEQGARGIVWAATAPDVPAGGFFRDGRPISW